MPNLPLNNSIDSIKNYFTNHGGLQLANRFSVSFSGIPIAIGITDALTNVPAEFVVLGPRSLSTIQDGLQGFGNGRFVPRSQNQLSGGYGVQIVFPISNDNQILKAFDNWFNYFYKGPKNTSSGGRDMFQVPYYSLTIQPVVMTINLLDPNGNVNSRIEFFETFPVETQPIELSMAFTDRYVRHAITFGYREFKQTVL